jgi:hypothetical protein
MAQTFGMIAEYARLKGDIDHNILPNVGWSLPDQAFDFTCDAKKVWVHPTDPKKTSSIRSYLHIGKCAHQVPLWPLRNVCLVSSWHDMSSQGTCQQCTQCGLESKASQTTSLVIQWTKAQSYSNRTPSSQGRWIHQRNQKIDLGLQSSIVPKKNPDVLRVCVYYTVLNKHCPNDPFPLPRIDQIIDSTMGCERLSFLDAYSGHNQIKLKEGDK